MKTDNTTVFEKLYLQKDDIFVYCISTELDDKELCYYTEIALVQKTEKCFSIEMCTAKTHKLIGFTVITKDKFFEGLKNVCSIIETVTQC